jgi:carboxypeptidase Taq
MKELKNYLNQVYLKDTAISLLYWDRETYMPDGANDIRAKQISLLSGEVHAAMTSPVLKKLLQKNNQKKLSKTDQKLIELVKYDLKLNTALPPKLVSEMSELTSKASNIWAKARKENDWKTFAPYLKKIIKLKQKEADYYGGKNRYNNLIKLFDQEMTSSKIDVLFDQLKLALPHIIAKVNEQKKHTQTKSFKGTFSQEQQQKINQSLLPLCGLDPNHSRLDISSHPFSINMGIPDQRITTRYNSHHLESIFSTLHEIGHAMYEANLPVKYQGTPLAKALSMSLHESQSRFWENMIGLSREFINYITPVLKKNFKSQLANFNADSLYYTFNTVKPSLIRVDSDELHYNLHIIIRYELEKALINGDLSVSDLPAAWNKMYKHYLHITPKNYSDGVMQDSHWAGGSFGYFPTYTIGNIYSAHFYQMIKKDLANFHTLVRKAELQPIHNWFKQHVHQHGKMKTGGQLIGGDLNAAVYLNYLKDKFII